MANALDYLSWRGDLLFTERPLNQVDNLILCELSYIDMSGIVPSPDDGGSVSLRELSETYSRLDRKQDDLFYNDPVPLLKAAGESPRFSSVEVGRYVNHIDASSQVQFSAVCFRLPDNSVYAAFRGTDNSVVGWREDFNFSFSEQTAGQREAVSYLESAAAALPGPLYVGGHSKGGNLAVYAAAFCDPSLRPRFRRIFSNDGPGFMESIAESENYQSVLPLVDLFLPESSIVGILLDNRGRRSVIRSSASGVMQHGLLSWQVVGTRFEEADSQSPASVFVDKTLRAWLSSLEPEQRRNVVSALFDALDASGAQTLFDVGACLRDSYSAVLKTLFEDPRRRREIFTALKKLSSAGHEVMTSGIKADLSARFSQVTAKLTKPKDTVNLPAGEGAGEAAGNAGRA